MWAAALWLLLLPFTPAFGAFAPSQTCLAPALPRAEVRRGIPFAKAIMQNCDDGQIIGRVLQVFRTVCYANYTYYIPCETQKVPQSISLEWRGHTMGLRISTTEFNQMLENYENDWLHGTTYGTAVLYFPHAAQAMLPMLNLPLMGDTVERFLINQFDPANGARNWNQHYEMFHGSRWLKELSECIMECLGISAKRGDESFYDDYNANGPLNPLFPPRPSAPRLLCFDKLVLPYNQLTCDRHFVDERREPMLWAAFRAHVFNRFGVRPLKASPIRIGFMERTNDRRILNQALILQMIQTKTGIPVTVLRFDKSMGLDVQVRSVSGFHVLVGPHGANLLNCLFVSPSAVVIEVYTRNYSMWCYYGDVLRKSGISYMKFCGPDGVCPTTNIVSGFGQYDRSDVELNADTLSDMVVKAVNMVKRWPYSRYSSMRDKENPALGRRSRNTARLPG